MIFMVCSCGEVLGNKELVYEEKMRKVCEDIGLDFDMISRGDADRNPKYRDLRKDIVNSICRRWCCKVNLITYTDLVNLIPGAKNNTN